MKNIIDFLIGAMILFVIQACQTKPLDIEIDPVESKTVVFSQVIPQLATTIVLTNTINALSFSSENGDTLTNDILENLLEDSALVTLSYRDEIDTLQESTRGIYTGLFIPQYINEVYKLDVITNSGKQLYAESRMLPIVPFVDIKPTINRKMDDTVVKITYNINDPDEPNWYVVNVYTNNDAEQDTNGVNTTSFFNGQSSFLVGTKLISDRFFPSHEFYDTMKFTNLNPTDSIVVSIANINETYYKYLQLRRSSMNLFSEITKEPINYPTNVHNGLGFFNTHFPDLRYFDLNNY